MRHKYNWLNHVLNFFAVILGVYLGFYINERAKQKEEQKEQTILIKAMIKELETDFEYFQEYQIPVNTKHVEALDTLLLYLVNEDREGINNNLGSIFLLDSSAPNSSIYNSIKSSGKIKLIDDLNAQQALEAFYDELALECSARNDFQLEFFRQELMSWSISNTDLLNMQLLSSTDLITLRNKVILYQSFISEKIEQYEIVLKDSKDLKTKLEALLD